MSNTSNIQKTVQLVELSLNEYYRDIQSIKKYDLELAQSMDEFHADYSNNFKEYLKLSLSDPNEGSISLTKLNDLILKNRIQYLERFIDLVTNRYQKKFNSPLWFEINTNTLDIIEEVSNITSQEEYKNDTLEGKLDKIKNGIQRFEESIHKINRYKEIAKVRLPYKILFWGIPIWIGLIVSDKFSLGMIIASFFILILVVIVTYFFVKRKKVVDSIDKTKKEKTNKLEIHKNIYNLTIVIVGLLFGLGSIMFSSKKDIAKYFSGDPINIEYDESFEIKSGEEKKIPITLLAVEEDIYNLSIYLMSEIIDTRAYFSLPLLGRESVNRNFSFSMPSEVPSGSYPFYIEIKYIQKSNLPILYDGFLTRYKKYNLTVTVKNDSLDSSK